MDKSIGEDAAGLTPQESAARQRWEEEKAFREREMQIKEKEQSTREAELQLSREQHGRWRWSSPLVIAILGAAVAGFGNAAVGFLSNMWQRELEAQKAEDSRILEAIKANPQQAAVNLNFLNNAGLITNPQRKANITLLLASREAGTGPSLESSISTTLIEASSATVQRQDTPMKSKPPDTGLVKSTSPQNGTSLSKAAASDRPEPAKSEPAKTVTHSGKEASQFEMPASVSALFVYLQKPDSLSRSSSSEIGTLVPPDEFLRAFPAYMEAARRQNASLVVVAQSQDGRWLQEQIVYKGKTLRPTRYYNPSIDRVAVGAEIPRD
jgi:hypothetical protein